MIGGEEPALEGDGEGGEGGLPSVHPAVGSFAGGVEGPHDKVEAVHGGLLGWEVPSCSGRSSHAAWRLTMALVSGMKSGCASAPVAGRVLASSGQVRDVRRNMPGDRKSTRLNSSH